MACMTGLRCSPFILVVIALTGSCSKDASSRTQAQLEALQKKKAQDAQEQAVKEAARAAPAQAPAIELAAPYGDAGNTVIAPDGPCPQGFWALLPTVAPGATAEEKKANAAQKKTLAEQLRARQYMVKLRAPSVKLSAYDAPKGQFVIEVPGTIDCTDATSGQRIAIAWTEAKAGTPAASAAKEGSELVQQIWQAPGVVFDHPVKSMIEAKAFESGNRIGLSARVVFKLGKVEVDRKLKRVSKVQEKAHGETLAFGGGDEDWGAGPLVHTELVAVRVASQGEKQQLYEVRP